jgi:hypothetical protein
MPDFDPTDEVPAEIATWQIVAQRLPLPQLAQMYDDAFMGLADSLNAFNRAYGADSPDCEALHRATCQAIWRSVAAAIFALGMTQRLHHHEAALN